MGVVWVCAMAPQIQIPTRAHIHSKYEGAAEAYVVRNFAHAAADGAGLVGAVPPLVAGAVQQLVAKSACGLCRGQWANAEGDERH